VRHVRVPRYSAAMRPPVLLLLLAAGCSAPDQGLHHSPLQSAQRVVALDFSPRRAEALGKLPAAIAHEGQRAAVLTRAPTLAGKEVRRAPAIASSARQIGGHELARRPQPAKLMPSAHRMGQRLADAIVTAWQLLVGKRPLGEPDDREHRTDPADTHPEAGWWQRLRRRLLL
jgi:hypothetical protein